VTLGIGAMPSIKHAATTHGIESWIENQSSDLRKDEGDRANTSLAQDFSLPSASFCRT